MKIEIITPASASKYSGNRITALRYARLLSRLGHRTLVRDSYEGSRCDLMIALHARRSLPSMRRLRAQKQRCALILVLTGTDLYRDIRTHRGAGGAMGMADRLVVLQSMGLREIPHCYRKKTRTIYQSAEKIRARVCPPSTCFRVCNIANLRPEKDPFRTALAAARLPSASRLRVIHIGCPLEGRMQESAQRQNALNPRYRWVGELPHWKARRILAASHLLAITSRLEGSSNALSEALASSVPVIATKIPGLVGTLGQTYPGYFPVGDTKALRDLLIRAEFDNGFYAGLKSRCARLSPLVSTERELECWRSLLNEL